MEIQLIRGDITAIKVDAIVNAANSGLLGGGGVDGAIHRKGGPAITEACRAIKARQGGCPTGDAVITTAGELPARWVIHTVGPVWQGGTAREPELLASCYSSSIRLALDHGIRSIAFPNISTGVYSYPKELAAAVALSTIKQYRNEPQLDRVIFVCYDEENYGICRRLLDQNT